MTHRAASPPGHAICRRTSSTKGPSASISSPKAAICDTRPSCSTWMRFLEEIAARVGGLGLVLDRVRERCFHDRVRRADPLCGVAADARTEPVRDRRETK